MDNRISLVVLGVTSNHIQSGAYVLVLAEENGPRRIPIVIGQAEAQSIAIAFEGIRPPRPITHDLFVTFAHAFGVRLRQVLIYRFDDGIFYSQLTFADPDGREVVVDSRTSDAIAIATRTGSPIVTTEKIMRATGFVIDDGTLTRANDTENDTGNSDDSDSVVYDRSRGYHAEPRPESFTIEELERTLANLIEREDYEEAARISEILEKKRRQKSGNDTLPEI